MPQHIVFVLSDQHNADIMGWRGDPWIRTPHMDALAADGVPQTACYCNSPMCVPSRASMLSTLLPQKTGVFTNDACLPSDRITFVHQLALAGYQTVLAGRMHFIGPDQRHGFRERLVGDISNTHWGGRSPEREIFKRYGGDERVLDESGPGDSLVLAYDRAVTDAACQRIAEHEPDVPLFLTVGLYEPHNPYVCDPEKFAYYYDRLPRLPVGVQPDDDHPAIAQHVDLHRMNDPDPEAYHRARAAYYGMVETLDEHVGRLRQAASDLGDDVLFIYASDHGDMCGQHGMFWKTMFYDGSAKVPIIATSPDLPAGHRIEAPTGLVDLGVTLLSACGAEPMLETDGIDLWPALCGKAPAPARPIISQYANRKPEIPPTAMFREGRYKLVVHGGFARPQFFDLETDPRECNDLAVNPSREHAALIKNFAERLYQQWSPDAANRAAKKVTWHMRRLHAFHDAAGAVMPEMWWPPDDFSERRDPIPTAPFASAENEES